MPEVMLETKITDLKNHILLKTIHQIFYGKPK